GMLIGVASIRRGAAPGLHAEEIALRLMNCRALSDLPRTVVDVRIERYTMEMASDVAVLIEDAFAEHRIAPPMQLLRPPEPWATRAELLETLTSDRICADAAHVALDAGRAVAAALAVRDGDQCAWWRIATAAGHRWRGLASACIEAGERALRGAGQQAVQTDAVVDSRWEGAGKLFQSLSYHPDEPDHRNITMAAEAWTPRGVAPPDGYTLDTLREGDLDEWIAVRNAVFGGERSVEWFHGRFMSRSDYDPAGWFVARHEGRMVGIAGAVCVEHERDPEHLRGAQIEWVGVLEEHRGRRLGEELVVACLNYAARRDFLPALLLTQPFRVPAVSLYEKLGFRTIAAWRRWKKRLC
ncbi:MAG: GNAT family N-acetyltransferase, partial [Armatimonadota bacterium]